MVRLSPKALRFAEDAAHELMRTPAFRGRLRLIWDSWNSGRLETASDPARTLQDGYVEVPDPVAEVLSVAVEQRLARMERQFARDEEADPELGNDIAFLHDVADAIRAELNDVAEAAQ